MKAEKANYPLNMMSELLHVSRSGFYDWLRREPKDDFWRELKADIERLWRDSDKVFGARMIFSKLPKDKGVTLYRVRKCMKELGIQGCQPRAAKRTTIADPKAQKRPDLIKRNFDVAVPTTKLVGDITYLKTSQGWLYLAVVIDLCTRMVVGWALDAHMKASLVVSALSMAYTRGYVAENAIFHSDLGSQYTSSEFANFADSISVRLSCGKRGSCFDNAVAESWFSSLKNERYYRYSYSTRAEARASVVQYIEAFYNRQRPHSSIDNQIPTEKMAAFFERMMSADSSEESAKLLAA